MQRSATQLEYHVQNNEQLLLKIVQFGVQILLLRVKSLHLRSLLTVSIVKRSHRTVG